MSSTVAVLFSGGLDSSILLAHLLAEGHQVRPLYIESGLVWQRQEQSWARRYVQALEQPGLQSLVVLSLPLADLYDDHWSTNGRDVPDASSPDERVYLPGRNPLLLIKADLWCRLHGVETLALGALANNPFADATDAFCRSFSDAMDQAAGGHVELVRPLASLDKRQVMHLVRSAPLELTFSCLAPQAEMHCGACNKCAERRRAFRDAELHDPTRYAAAARTAVH